MEVAPGVGASASRPRETALLPQCRSRFARLGSGGAETGSIVSVIMIFVFVVWVHEKAPPEMEGLGGNYYYGQQGIMRP